MIATSTMLRLSGGMRIVAYLYPELLREFTAAERPLFAYYARHAQGDALAEAA
ncbi:hypothetical protein [Xanthomonas citri]|uniref:hypothetical protein n=1 Tax=Xanthomonas citri TaxID=346 RepID=UPI0021CF3BC5|nr:hypothetical protein [Xanthomonas citri]